MDDQQDDPRVLRTRRRTHDAALEVIGEHGLQGATIERIADCAGVHKTTLYRHWPTPTDLFVEVLDQEMAAPEPPDSGDARADLLTMMRGFARTITRRPWSALLPSLLGASAHDDELGQLHARFVEQRRSMTAGVVRRGIDAGQLDQELDADLIVDLLIGPIFYRAMMQHRDVPASYCAQILEAVLGPA